MAITDVFIRRPVLASVVSLMILFVGLRSLFALPIREYPELTNTTITVTTLYPGASAALMKGFVTTPMQQAVAGTEGVDTIESYSAQGVSTVTLNLRLNADPDRATADVLVKVRQVAKALPEGANDPIVHKQTGTGIALMYIAFQSDTMTSAQITDYLTRVTQPYLQTIEGVGNTEITGGGETFAMRIWLDPKRMAALGITANDVRTALASNNVTFAAGEIKSQFTQTAIDAKTSLKSVEGFERLVVAAHGDTLIRLGDVARVEIGPGNANSSGTFNGAKGVAIGVYATPTANPLSAIKNVRKQFPGLLEQLPPNLTAHIAYDATEFISASIDDVVKTIAEASVIVIIVVFLFLGNVRSAFIPIVTIPLSLVGVMMILLGLGYSINLLTLMALVLAIGLVVDDAIVVVENIHRHIGEGMAPLRAALQGAREIALPVVSMAITLAAVYAPIGFMSGLTGTLFKEFAFTLAGSVVISGVIALILSPMLCSKLLKRDGETRFAKALDRNFSRLKRGYARLLQRGLNARPVILLILGGTIGAAGIMYVTTQKELAPNEDQGFLVSLIQSPKTANLNYMEHYTKQLSQVFSSIPEADYNFILNGTPDPHNGLAGLVLKPWDERSRSANDIQQALGPGLAEIAGVKIQTFSPPALPGVGGGLAFQFVVTTIGDYSRLAAVIGKLADAARKSGLFLFTTTDLDFDTPQIDFTIDRGKANSLGVKMSDIATTLTTLLSGSYVNRFSLYGRSYQVIPQVPRQYRATPQWLTQYRVRTASGDLVPLSTIAKIEHSVQPYTLKTFQQLNAATLSGVLYPGRSMGEAIAFMEQKAAELLPGGFYYDYNGGSRQYIQEGNRLVVTFAFALIVIYLVLAAQFESFRDPFIILIALPTSIFGALIPLNFGLGTLNIYTQIGLVTLIGLISKHGILMVEFANKLQIEEGLDKHQAIIKAASVRLRPILMTTAAMVSGMVPLILSQGAGAESRYGIGLVIAAGMSIGTLFTLFVTPAVYTYIARDHKRSAAVEEGA
ncbi:MAG: efflux RND transporter permease subunit [Hyphomicrobiales bacterium]